MTQDNHKGSKRRSETTTGLVIVAMVVLFVVSWKYAATKMREACAHEVTRIIVSTRGDASGYSPAITCEISVLIKPKALGTHNPGEQLRLWQMLTLPLVYAYDGMRVSLGLLSGLSKAEDLFYEFALFGFPKEHSGRDKFAEYIARSPGLRVTPRGYKPPEGAVSVPADELLPEAAKKVLSK